MPERLAYVNGWVGPESQASISIYDRGFLSGYGVFERTRTLHGELFRLDEHLARLYRSLRVTRLEAPMSRAELRAVTIDLVAQNRKLLGPDDDYSVGHYVTRGLEGSGRPTVVVFCQPIPFKTFARQYISAAHSSSWVDRSACARSPAKTSVPWLAINAAVFPSSASSTTSASSGVPNVRYGATRTVPPRSSIS